MKSWSTGNTELFLKCQTYLEKFPAATTSASNIAIEICSVVEQLEYNDSELARIEADDLLQHEEGDKTWHSFCLKKGAGFQKNHK